MLQNPLFKTKTYNSSWKWSFGLSSESIHKFVLHPEIWNLSAFWSWSTNSKKLPSSKQYRKPEGVWGNWKEYKSTNGRPYYYNTLTRVNQWERPEGWRPVPPSSSKRFWLFWFNNSHIRHKENSGDHTFSPTYIFFHTLFYPTKTSLENISAWEYAKVDDKMPSKKAA